jgi:hypothetical protein
LLNGETASKAYEATKKEALESKDLVERNVHKTMNKWFTDIEKGNIVSMDAHGIGYIKIAF